MVIRSELRGGRVARTLSLEMQHPWLGVASGARDMEQMLRVQAVIFIRQLNPPQTRPTDVLFETLSSEDP